MAHWTFEDHKKWYPNNFDDGMIRSFVDKFKPSSVFEFGCGIGHYCNYMSNSDIPIVHGVEPAPMDPNMFQNEGCENIVWDITKDPEPSSILPTYDAIVSIEVMEHINKKFHAEIFDYLVSKNPRVVLFSAARPGQGGNGHIAERHEREWIDEWEKRGYRRDKISSDIQKKACNKRNINHVRNCNIYFRNDD